VFRRDEPFHEAFLVEVVAARELAPQELVLLRFEGLPADAAVAVHVFALDCWGGVGF
jgi:hypothetical protein